MYRVDRHDIQVIDPEIWGLDDDALLAKLAAMPSVPHSWIQQLSYWRLRELHTNACGDFTLLDASYWHLLRGHPRDETVLTLDIASLLLHAAAAYGVKECRLPPACKVVQADRCPPQQRRTSSVWSSWRRRLDHFLVNKVSPEAAHWARTTFDYPRRKMLGVNSITGPSIERNFVQPASRWARGELPMPTQPEDWGLVGEPLEERILCHADRTEADSAASS